ncbi:DegT/DnrJ/EryC1/StrS family aminotransferase [uncultured Flavobacterium sp.]|uniref:DegT/DnrJ/EryC1/StrS family aminotransferase n=1 Tax=uncultured Flavobacterium sp. TaxID=165435 RepID=UPI0025E07BF0|nr:DegT/DnrJ/EryC1/StrS family aminotransferase [uncultured Flavobacterium sp.]
MIPIYKPYMPQGIDSEIVNILYSGQLGYGKYGREFESKLQNFIECKYVLSVSSYNIAMLIVLSTLGLKKGDEIIASPVSCLASNQPFAVKDLKVVWVDINPETGGMCPEDLKSKITTKTKAIFHNHFCGYLGNIEEINTIGNSFGIPVIDDGIEAFGSEYKNRKLGNVGTDITVFSFQTVRLPNTIDGGAIVFKDKELYEKALLIRDYGIDREIFRTNNGEINPECDIKLEGYGGLMSELNSYLGTKQMDDVEGLLMHQKKNAFFWNEKIIEMKNFSPLKLTDNCEPNYWVYGILCNNKEMAIKHFKEKGYYATGVHINNNVYTVFDNKDYLKGVSEFMSRFLAIPCGWWFENK